MTDTGTSGCALNRQRPEIMRGIVERILGPARSELTPADIRSVHAEPSALAAAQASVGALLGAFAVARPSRERAGPGALRKRSRVRYRCAACQPDGHLDELNPAQREAVVFGVPKPARLTPGPPLLIIAGAGTGKTSTLAHRVAHLVLSGADPRRILLLTFSRRAARR